MVKESGKTLLLITSSAGGGHVQAARAQELNARASDPTITIIERDILIDWVGKRLGRGFVSLWNQSQKKGRLALLSFLSRNLPAADLLFGIPIFFHALWMLLSRKIDRVVDTQPVGTRAIVRAIRLANKMTGSTLLLEKIITELPTAKLTHFFRPVRNLSAKERNYIQLITTLPLVKEQESADAFWQKECGLREQEVCYAPLPLRPAFRKPLHKVESPTPLSITTYSDEELALTLDALRCGAAPFSIQERTIHLTIGSSDHVTTILLGSQPSEEATIEYVRRYIDLVQPLKTCRSYLLFVFCSHHRKSKKTLLRRIHDHVCHALTFSNHLTIIPATFQGDQVIAPLYYRSNMTITRSGGLTSMELLQVAQGQIWIHSESRSSSHANHFYRGMPLWEQGNADYLQQKRGARFITPDLFSQLLL